MDNYSGRRRATVQAPYVQPAAVLVQDRFAGPDGPAPKPVPAPDPDDRLVPYERALDMIKNVVVIVTCLVVLYAMWSVYSALAEVSQRLEQLPL